MIPGGTDTPNSEETHSMKTDVIALKNDVLKNGALEDGALHTLLENWLKGAREGMDALIGAVARHSSPPAAGAEEKQGAPDPDAFQSEGFQLAHLHALLYALEALMDDTGVRPGEKMGAAFFGAECMETLRGAFPRLAGRLGVDRSVLRPVMEEGQNDDLILLVHGEAFQAAMMEALEEMQGPGGVSAIGMGGLSPEHTLLRETFHAFAKRKVKPAAEALHREDRLIPDALIAEAAELGCFGLSIPARHGGAAERPDNLGMVVVTEELSRGALIMGSLITRPEILAKALLSGGTPEQQERFLPPMASGEKMVAISVTEPDFGSDVANLKTTATPVEGGWRINGTKVWSTFAGRAELIGLLARTETDAGLGHRGLSMFVVEKPPFDGHHFEHAPPGGGRLSGRAIATLGYRGMHSFELIFEDYFLPGDNLVGGEAGRGRGFYLQMEGFAHGRLQTSGRALGLMQAAFDEAWSYGSQRKVFGKILNVFPLTRSKLIRMAANILAGRRATYAAARLLDAGEGRMEASLVKLFTCRNAEWITREAMQVHGGMGYAEEFPVSRYFADARVLSIFEGAEEVLALKVILPSLLKVRGR